MITIIIIIIIIAIIIINEIMNEGLSTRDIADMDLFCDVGILGGVSVVRESVRVGHGVKSREDSFRVLHSRGLNSSRFSARSN